MGTFNSAQDGNFNDDATWTEAGHPTSNDDVTIITHDVTYDVGVSAVTWGNCTINSGGILIFPIAANSKMLFNATGILTINNGGELRAGTSGSPIGSSYLCQLHWPQGASTRNVLVLNNGGKIDIYGDPAYYGSVKTAILDSQWAVGSGLTCYVEGDYSAKWAAGQFFIIHDFAVYADYQTDAEVFEIDSVGAYDAGNDRTPITVTAAGDSDTFLVEAKLWMLSRNVELLDPGSPTAIYGYASYTRRLRFDNNQDAARGAASNVHINETLFRGWMDAVTGGDRFVGDGLSFLNCYNIFNGAYYTEITDSLVASFHTAMSSCIVSKLEADFVGGTSVVPTGYNTTIVGDIVGCRYGVETSPKGVSIIGNINSCYIGIQGSPNVRMEGNIDGCQYGILSGAQVELIGDIKNCTIRGVSGTVSLSVIGSVVDNAIGIYQGGAMLKFKNGEFSNTADLSAFIGGYDKRAAIFEDYTIGGTKRELEIYANAGNILCFHNGDAHWQAPPSGESFILEMLPNTYCNTGRSEWLSLSPDPLNMMFTYVTAGAKTLTFKVYPVGWSSSPDQDDIVLEAFYLAGAGVTRTRVVNTTATYANAGWRDLEVSFTTGQAGIVYFVIHLKKYEAGDYVLIDPEWTVS